MGQEFWYRFLNSGHQVIYPGEILDSGAKDELVAATAILNKAALIAIDLDMKRLVRRFGSPLSGHGPRFSRLI
jgi:predicted nuclease of predicted toxin-antitoxin system